MRVLPVGHGAKWLVGRRGGDLKGEGAHRLELAESPNTPLQPRESASCRGCRLALGG